MDFVLGPDTLATPFSFTVPENNRLNCPISKVFVHLSGGLDSAALLCLILEDLKQTNRLDKISVVALTITKADASTYYASRVVQKVSERFGVAIEHQNNKPNTDRQFKMGRASYAAMFNAYMEHRLEAEFYIGINKTAPDEIRPFPHKLLIPYREEFFFLSPFLNLHKPQILDLYSKLDCESIMQWTHSCDVLPIGHCGNCYSCVERNWGLTALGKTIDSVPPDVDDVSFGNTWINPMQ